MKDLKKVVRHTGNKSWVGNKAWFGLGLAVLIGAAAVVVKKVAAKDKSEDSSKKYHKTPEKSMSEKAVKVGSDLASNVKDGLDTVADTVKTETVAAAQKLAPNSEDTTSKDEDSKEEEIPEPVKAAAVVMQTEKADTKAETAKNNAAKEKLKEQASTPVDDKPAATKKVKEVPTPKEAATQSVTVKKTNAKPEKAKPSPTKSTTAQTDKK